MGYILLSSGGGADVSGVTATLAMVLESAYYVNKEGELVPGKMADKSGSGSKTPVTYTLDLTNLTPASGATYVTVTQNIATGYYNSDDTTASEKRNTVTAKCKVYNGETS